MRTKDELLEHIRDLQADYLAAELGDDRAWSNGTLGRIKDKLTDAKRELADLYGPSCQPAAINDGGPSVV